MTSASSSLSSMLSGLSKRDSEVRQAASAARKAVGKVDPDEAPKRTASGEDACAAYEDLRATRITSRRTMGQRLTINPRGPLVIVVGCWAVFKAVLHEAQAQTDAGVELVQARADERFKAIEAAAGPHRQAGGPHGAEAGQGAGRPAPAQSGPGPKDAGQ